MTRTWTRFGRPAGLRVSGLLTLGWLLQTDWDGDGDTDLVSVTNSIPKTRAYVQAGVGSFDAATQVDLGDWSKGGPFPFNPTRTGPASLLVGHQGGLRIYGTSDGAVSWSPTSNVIEITNMCGDIYDAREHDVDGDGLLDVLGLGSNAGCDPYVLGEYEHDLHNLAILRGRTDGGLEPPTYVEIGAPARAIVAIEDLDGDGVDDIVLDQDSNVGFSGYSVLLGRSAGTFASPELYEYELADTTPVLDAIGDFDGDGDLDGLFYTWLSPLSFADDIPAAVYEPVGWTSLRRLVHAVGDFNGDGVDDLVVVDSRYMTSEPWADSPEHGTGLLLSAP